MKYIFTLVFSLFTLSVAMAQCPNTNILVFGSPADLTPSAVGDSVSNTCVWGGDYLTLNVVTGNEYKITLCNSTSGVTYDPIITLYNQSTGDYIGENDNYCGVLPQITYTADFNGTLRILLDQSGTCNTVAQCAKLTVKLNGTGCTDPDIPTIAVDTICAGASSTLNVSAGNLNDATAWNWYTGSCGGTNIGTGTSMTVSPSTTTTYYVRGEGGCITPGSCKAVTVVVNNVSASTSVDSTVSCNGYADGGATASATGGTPPYTYAWSNSATTASIAGVVAGTYTVTTTDAKGCTDTDSVTITEPSALVAATTLDSNVTCFGYANGGATASATGGTTPYTYAWSNFDTTASITSAPVGSYSVWITDANGCMDSASVTISLSSVIENAGFGFSNANYCTSDPDPNPTITGTTGGVFTSSSSGLVIDSISGQIDLSASSSGNYTVTYTTPNTICWVDSTIAINIIPEDDPSFSYTFDGYCLTYSDPTPIIYGSSGGIFTANPIGLVIDSLTGQVDLSASAVGQFIVQYTTQGICQHAAFDTLNLTDDTTPVPVEIYQSGIKTDSITGATYKWLDCYDYSELTSETQTILQLDTTQSGSYAVEVTRPGCIDTSACIEISFYSLVEHFDTLSAPSYYKPFPDNFQVKFAEAKPYVEYQLLNKYGVVLFDGSGTNIDNIILDMSPYQDGDYFLDVMVGTYEFRVRLYR